MSIGKKINPKSKEKYDRMPEPRFSELDDSTKIQLEIERQSLTQTIDGLKKQLKPLEAKEKEGPLDEKDEDEKDRILEQLDALYRQRNDLYERVQKKLDEQKISRKSGKPRDYTERPDRPRDSKGQRPTSSNSRKYNRVSDEV